MKQKKTQILWFLTGVIAAVFMDQWTKYLAVLHLKAKSPFVIWDGVFELFYSENRGAAFGMLQGRQVFFLLITVVVLVFAGHVLLKMPADKKYVPVELCLILISSGAAGNMIDRVRQGFVVDFLYFKLIDFPIFNVADCYVVISTILMMLLVFFYYSEEDLSFMFPPKQSNKPDQPGRKTD